MSVSRQVIICILTDADGNVREKKRNKTAKAKRVILILFKMFPKDIFGHFHHAVNLIFSSLLLPSFNTSRINETSSGLKRSPCRFAFVIRASMTGASSFRIFLSSVSQLS